MIVRLTEPGRLEMARLRVLLREMRRHIHTHGKMPRLDSPDAELQQAWIGIGRVLEQNARVGRQRIRRELRGCA